MRQAQQVCSCLQPSSISGYYWHVHQSLNSLPSAVPPFLTSVTHPSLSPPLPFRYFFTIMSNLSVFAAMWLLLKFVGQGAQTITPDDKMIFWVWSS